MHTDGQADHVGDQQQVLLASLFIGLFIPHHHQMHDDGHEERRRSVHFRLNGVEPEGVGKGIGECCNEGRTIHEQGVLEITKIFREEVADHADGDQVQQQHSDRTGNNRHEVNAPTWIAKWQKVEHLAKHQEEWCSRWVRNLLLNCRSSELTTVPERNRWLHCKQERDERNKECDRCERIVQ